MSINDEIIKYVNKQLKFKVNKNGAIKLASIKYKKSVDEIKKILGE